MELTIYDIIKGPVISDKAYKLNKKLSQLVLEVHLAANKSLVKDALEKLFNVKVAQVRTLIRKYARPTGGRRRQQSTPSIAKMKVAYVTLKEGHTLNLFEQATTAASSPANDAHNVKSA